jgi:cAMP phosphodiesterase
MGTPPSTEEALPVTTTLKSGPFAGIPFPHASARANALHVVREHVSTYLITHPHLDHVSGFVINTAAFHNTSRPKRLAALPFTVNAIKTHIFNNILWPNLTDEDGGVGLVTFQRLQEGGNIALGEGSGRGYIEVCDGLGVRGFKVSHGHCMRGPGHVHRGSNVNLPETPVIGIQRSSTHPHHHSDAQGIDGREGRSLSFSLPAPSAPGTPKYTTNTGPDPGRAASVANIGGQIDQCVIDSTAYFIRTESSPHAPCKEVLIFGDVEPDSISLSPRTAIVWAEAAPKIAAGILAGIFIECSYTNAQGDSMLFGHLSPRHLLIELQNLADMVRDARREMEREKEEARKGRKRKRASNGLLGSDGVLEAARKSSKSRGVFRESVGVAREMVDDEIMTDLPGTGTHTPVHNSSSITSTVALNSAPVALINLSSDPAPLKGLKVVIIHVKDTLVDGPLVADRILDELNEGERVLGQQGGGLGCAFEVSRSGDSYWF